MKLALGIAGFGCVLFGGCTSPKTPREAVPFSVTDAATAVEARSLSDVGLRAFLRTNLGREPVVWDFDSLTWVAFYYQPSLAVARAQWKSARAAEQTATARPNPTVSLVPGYNSTRQAGVSPWFPGLSFDFLIQNRGQSRLRQAAAQSEAEAVRLSTVADVWRVRSELRRTLQAAESADARSRALQEQARLQEKIVALLEQRRAAGTIAGTELSTARLASLVAGAASAEGRRQATAARAQVAAVVGVPLAAFEGVSLPAARASSETNADAVTARRGQALRSRADVLSALAHYQSAQAALELEIAKRRPGLHFGPGYQWDQGANKWSIALTFEIPLFNHNEGPIAEAVARRTEAGAKFLVVQAGVIASIDAAILANAAAEERVRDARAVERASQARAEATAQRLALGGADQLEVQTTLLELATQRLALTDAEAAAQSAAGQLEDALQIPSANLLALISAGEPTHL